MCYGRQMSVQEGPQVNKFEQVSNDGHQISLAGELGSSMFGVQMRTGAGGGVPCVMSRVPGPGAPDTVKSKVSWVMVIWGPPGQTDRHEWKQTSLAGGKYF